MPQPEQDLNQEPAVPETLTDCQEQLAEISREAVELRDKYLRAAAEIENTRKRTERDVQARAMESRRDLLRQLLEVMDNLERTLAHPNDFETIFQGVQITHRQLETVLARAGADRLDIQPGDPFDPTFQEAVEVGRGDVEEPTVAAVVQPGYLHENVLLRPARVIVIQ